MPRFDKQLGQTLRKLRPEQLVRGANILDVFKIDRPRTAGSFNDLFGSAGTKLRLKFRDPPETGLKGVIVPFPDGSGALINLSFGISVLDAVRDYALTSADFSATDLTIELLYLVEAKSAAMDASRKLNLRLQEAMIAAREQAYTDALTGLKNRRAVDVVLDRRVAGAESFALMHIDLDFFKQVNDTLGHAAGDHVLETVARIMQQEVRESDSVARVGGDEFVIVIDGLTNEQRLDDIATNIIAGVRQPILFKDQFCRVSASIGTAICCEGETTTAENLMHRADVALYAAKNAGRSQHMLYRPEMEEDTPQSDVHDRRKDDRVQRRA